MAFQLDNIAKPVPLKKKPTNEVSFLKKEITLFSSVFSNKVKEDFYTELGVLLKAGVSLKDSLDLIKNSQKKQYNKNVLNNIVNNIISGQTFSDTLKTEKPFTEYEYYSIKIGEETGTLAQVSEQLGGFFTRKNEQRRQVINALTYPIIILSTAVVAVVFMLQYVVPMFQDIFKQQGVELPSITQFIINISESLSQYGWIFFLVFLGLFVLQKLLNKKQKYKQLKDTFLLKIPLVGSFLKLVYLSQFTQAVSLLTASKVPVVNSIQLVKQMIQFHPLQHALETVEKHILKGESLSKSLSYSNLFADKMIALVKVAEETNQTEFIFDRLNQQYNTQVQQRSKTLSTIMEPFIILFIGIIVGVILIAMYLPMFKLSSVLG